uniref:Uncharacterized protein n=1 Tax=Meloidogyne enterolobii TaxID=390850 RepID=A0A6V7U231_MELEN|nr:unnamed protein product [Meloidogyne enterolobii]
MNLIIINYFCLLQYFHLKNMETKKCLNLDFWKILKMKKIRFSDKYPLLLPFLNYYFLFVGV